MYELLRYLEVLIYLKIW